MRELPKELTAELLSLVLDKDISGVYPDLALENSDINYTTYANIAQGTRSYDINIDTLTRLMKEWCLKQKYWVSSELTSTSKGIVGCGVFGSEEHLYSEVEDTEFEAVLKATQWVAKEKGLI